MTKTIQNWAGNVQFKPKNYLLPEHADEIATYIRQATQQGKKIRTVGSAHSFSPLIETQDWLLSLDRYQGLTDHSKTSGAATVKAGTKLYTLGECLFQEGLAMENLGDIDRQSLAGALTTGTHGSGTGFGILATQVEELSLLDGQGEPHLCSRTQAPELFRAALVSMGLLGVITELKLRLEPAYRLHYVHRKGHLDETLENLEDYKRNNRNFEFYWFPYTKSVQLKLVNRTDDSPRNNGALRWVNDVLIENAAFGLLSRYARQFPSQAMNVSRLCGKLISDGERVDWSHRVFATARLVPFLEMEYNIPAENFVGALRDMETAINKHRFAVHFPVECRWAKADDLLLSPATGRNSAYIAVHTYKGMPHKAYFETLEAIFKAHGGRPHWGKMNTCSATDFEQMYPDWHQFLAIREKMDPNRIFMNAYFSQLIG
jgi:FAD-linked oxidoreductase